MTPIKCFFVTPTERTARSLRRYSRASPCPLMPDKYGYHNAMVPVEEGTVVHLPDDCYTSTGVEVDKDDPRWPRQCGCGYVFLESDEWQVHYDIIHVDQVGKPFITEHRAVVGTMWHCDHYLPEWKGPDGHCLAVKTPGGVWLVDSRASNCTMPDDDVHKCWVRHGEQPYENITVDKAGFTCAAGAGSILCNDFHGFLRNGYLVS